MLVCLSVVVVAGCGGRAAREEPANDPSEETEHVASEERQEPTAQTNDCAANAEWRRCVGKRVRVVGRPAPDVMQHPMPPPGAAEETVDYVDVDGAQLVVVLKSPMQCAGQVEITGILREVNLNGPAGTKEEYRGYRVEDASSRCL
ncbi:MAG: hypothetical protein U0271_20075 [Polyangiaceae bacterium]